MCMNSKAAHNTIMYRTDHLLQWGGGVHFELPIAVVPKLCWDPLVGPELVSGELHRAAIIENLRRWDPGKGCVEVVVLENLWVQLMA